MNGRNGNSDSEELLGLARRFGSPSAISAIERLRDEECRRELTVVVAGQFKRGKSTFINALLGTDLLPTGMLPVTAIPTVVRFGPLRVTIEFLDEARPPLEISPPELKRYVTEQGNPENRLLVRSAAVTVPAPILAGVAMIDSPGIASTYAHNTGAALETLTRADLAILVVGAEPPIGEAELAFARKVLDASERLFIVLNKVDQIVNDKEREPLIEFTRKTLAGAREDGDVRIFPLSATRGQGLGDFVATFRDFVEAHGREVFERSLRRKATRDAAWLLRSLLIEREALRLPLERRAALAERFATFESELPRRAGEIVDTLDRAAREDLRLIEQRLEDRKREALVSLEQRLRSAVEHGDLLAYRQGIADGVGSAATAWVEEVRRELQARMQRNMERVVARTVDLERSTIAEGLAGLGLGALAPPELAFELPALRFEYADEQATTGAELVARAVDGLLPQPVRATLLARRLRSELEAQLDRRAGRIRYRANQAIRDGYATLAQQVGASLERARADAGRALQQAVEGADEAEAIARRSSELEQAADRLRQFAHAASMQTSGTCSSPNVLSASHGD